MKIMTLRISYKEYAISQEDAVILLGVASRMRMIERPAGKYSGPFQYAKENVPFVEAIALDDLEEPEREAEPLDKFTAATREV